MIPAVIMVLDRFPTGGTGKIDRRALPEPDTQRPDLDIEYVAPETDEERLITSVFATILGLDRVGTQDNLFHLGCTSLQSAAVATAIDEAANVIVPVSQIHRTPTPHGLAQWLTTAPRRPHVDRPPVTARRRRRARPARPSRSASASDAPLRTGLPDHLVDRG